MKRTRYYTISALLICCTMGLSVSAQTDTIRLKDKRLMTSVLKPGLQQYLIYIQLFNKPKSLRFSYWMRDIQLENRNNEKVFAITQHWYSNDSVNYRSIYSLNKAADFAPVYHAETVNDKIKAYNWYADKITGADSVTQNLQNGFSLDFKTPNFNWNLDIETLEMLPLAAGKTFAINFYDAGLNPPAYVIYKVTGSEVITTLDNEHSDCWKLFTESDYNGYHYSETYWISKKEHEFLKEEQSFNGGHRLKIRMMGAAPDLLKQFKTKG